jgi:hypothetical protein
MLISQLINMAYIFSGIVARGLDSVSSQQSTDGIFLLNLLLGEMQMMPDYIPYYNLINMPAVAGQENYFFENVAEVVTVTFLLDQVRYSLKWDNRNHYFGSPRAENISSLPFRVYWERVLGGTQVSLYFFPINSSIELQMKCKMFLPNNLTNSSLDTDLNTIFDTSYQSYLMYLLVKKICQWNKITVNPEILKELQRFQQIMDNMNAKDFTVVKSYSLAKGESLTYADINFGRGWTT